jgi:hypothetical protein
VGFVPLSKYRTVGRSFKGIDKTNYKLAETAGVYIVSKVTEKISRLTRIQNVDNQSTKNLPEPVRNHLRRKQLHHANWLQEKFMRNGKKVDAEIRQSLIQRLMREEGAELTENQKKVFSDLGELFGGEEGGGWKPVKSPNEEVKMKVKYHQQKKGKMSIALGRAEGVAACTAEEAAAWYFEFCSRQRVASSRREGNQARLEIRSKGQRFNQKVFATVKIMPLMLKNREFVFTNVLKRNANSFSVASWPVEDKIDYGGGMGKLVKATSKAIFTATNLKPIGEIPQSKLELLQYIDAGGYIPVSLINKKLPLGMSAVGEVVNNFKQDDEVDKVALASLANTIKNERQDYTEEEMMALEEAKGETEIYLFN